MLRYSLTWEDADMLLAALAPRPGATLLSICGAGDNALALLLADPAEVVAVDYNPAQLAALALRIAAFQTLDHADVLALLGLAPHAYRRALYARCRPHLPPFACAYWDARPADIDVGIGWVGRFEAYLGRFRRYVLPLVHRRAAVGALLAEKDEAARTAFYDAVWDTPRWRFLFRLFCSRAAMRSGRDAAYLAHAKGDLAGGLLARARHACTHLDPSKNPYLRWILTGAYGAHLPLALRLEHFETIRARAHRVTLRVGDLASVARALPPASVDGFNLSDVFEYLDERSSAALHAELARVARPGARLVYWNLFVPRARAEALADVLVPVPGADTLHAQDRAFFYRRLVVEARAQQGRRAA